MNKTRLFAVLWLASSVGACGREVPDNDPADGVTTATPATVSTQIAPDGTELAAMTGDPAKGATVFLRCRSCHAVVPGENGIGPSLSGIVGRHSGELPGFAYSIALKNSGVVWSPEKLDQFLEKPARVVPGTKMAFAGLSESQERADVIAYLQSAAK